MPGTTSALIPECKSAGKPEPTLQLYDNNANCIQAILAGRADTYVNDVNMVDQAGWRRRSR